MSKTIMKIYSIFKFYKILEKDLQLYYNNKISFRRN